MFANVNDFREKFFFLFLVAFWKIVWKMFYSVWSNVKWKEKKKSETQYCNPTTAIHHKSTANHRRKTHKPTITAKPTQSKSRTNQNKQIKTHKSSQSWATPVLGAWARQRERWWHEHEHTGSCRSRARAHRFSSGPNLGWLRSRGRFDRGAASIAGRRVQIWGGFDLGRVLESHRAALNHELTDLIDRLVGSGSGAAERERAEKESRERESRKRAEKESRGERAEHVF